MMSWLFIFFDKLSVCFDRSFAPMEFDIVQHYFGIVERFLVVDEAVGGGRAAQMWPGILHKCFESLRGQNLVMTLVKIIMRGYRNQMTNSNLHHFCECFAGVGNLTRELLRAGYEGSGFDNVYSESQNLLESSGLQLVLNCLTSLRCRGLLWLGTPCSSFVVLCRAQSMRHESNSFLGDTSRGFVVIGNALGEMSSLLYFIAWCLCIWVVLEQPHSSCLPSMPSMSTVFRFCGAKKYVTYMGQYGGSSMKQLQLWSTWPKISGLECPRPYSGGGEALVTRDGAAYTGNKDLLELSQVYTKCFGRAVARLCQSEWMT